jgi:hypothetical protein
MIDVPIDMGGTTITIRAKSGWVTNVDEQGVAGWVEKSVFEASGITENIIWDNEPDGGGEGVFVKCLKNSPCSQESAASAKTGANSTTVVPYETVAFNPTYNNSLQLGDRVYIEELGEKVVGDTGGGRGSKYDATLPDDAWLDYYLGIQSPGEMWMWAIDDRGIGDSIREVKVFRQ